jgi:hypothetical protein
MPTRSEQLSHLPVPPQEASLAATHPVGTGCDPTDKTAVASGSSIVKVLGARQTSQSNGKGSRDSGKAWLLHCLPMEMRAEHLERCYMGMHAQGAGASISSAPLVWTRGAEA